MKKILSIIVVGLIVLVALSTIPSNIITSGEISNSEYEYAAIPPVEPPTKPPRR